MPKTQHSLSEHGVALILRVARVFVEEGNLAQSDYYTIAEQLKHLAKTGTPKPAITPRLLSSAEVADLLGLGISNFKKIEHTLPFKRRMVSGSVKFCNIEVYNYIVGTARATDEIELAFDKLS
ncbi:MAG: hypothetical protein IJJ33_17550 [Victivallales bacterium]|nr:hypothetical protein [Victivallales bacterium]MBQ6473796.1 hypothetical protein [Victivallales bacterium]